MRRKKTEREQRSEGGQVVSPCNRASPEKKSATRCATSCHWPRHWPFGSGRADRRELRPAASKNYAHAGHRTNRPTRSSSAFFSGVLRTVSELGVACSMFGKRRRRGLRQSRPPYGDTARIRTSSLGRAWGSCARALEQPSSSLRRLPPSGRHPPDDCARDLRPLDPSTPPHEPAPCLHGILA